MRTGRLSHGHRWSIRSAAAVAVIAVAVVLTSGSPGQPPAQSGDLAAALAAAQTGGNDYFLKLDGIQGESTDARHAGEIDVDSWQWGVSSATTAGGATGGMTGKATFSDLSFTMPTSKAGPQLVLATASGRHLKEAKLTVRKGGESLAEYLIITLSDVQVTDYRSQGQAGGTPADEAALTYTKIRIEYFPQNPDGTLGNRVTVCWDITANKQC